MWSLQQQPKTIPTYRTSFPTNTLHLCTFFCQTNFKNSWSCIIFYIASIQPLDRLSWHLKTSYLRFHILISPLGYRAFHAKSSDSALDRWALVIWSIFLSVAHSNFFTGFFPWEDRVFHTVMCYDSEPTKQNLCSWRSSFIHIRFDWYLPTRSH